MGRPSGNVKYETLKTCSQFAAIKKSPLKFLIFNINSIQTAVQLFQSLIKLKNLSDSGSWRQGPLKKEGSWKVWESLIKGSWYEMSQIILEKRWKPTLKTEILWMTAFKQERLYKNLRSVNTSLHQLFLIPVMTGDDEKKIKLGSSEKTCRFNPPVLLTHTRLQECCCSSRCVCVCVWGGLTLHDRWVGPDWLHSCLVLQCKTRSVCFGVTSQLQEGKKRTECYTGSVRNLVVNMEKKRNSSSSFKHHWRWMGTNQSNRKWYCTLPPDSRDCINIPNMPLWLWCALHESADPAWSLCVYACVFL